MTDWPSLTGPKAKGRKGLVQRDRRFTERKLTRSVTELGEQLYMDTRPLAVEWQEGRLEETSADGWRPCPPGAHWGRKDIWVAFRAQARSPSV